MSAQQACRERIRLLQAVTDALSAHSKAAEELGAAATIETDEVAFQAAEQRTRYALAVAVRARELYREHIKTHGCSALRR